MHDPFGACCRHGNVRLAPTATGPLDGLSFVAKDLFAVAGHRNCCGSPDWLRTHEAAPASAPVVERLLAAGAELAAMATMDELAYSVAGRNAHYGTPINPASPERIPGGSSSGAGAAVAGDLADFAIGTDTTGSIRTPGALCGVPGLRPTHGAIDVAGVVPLAPSFDTVGVLARSLTLLLRVARALALPSKPVSLRRAVMAEDAMALADPSVRAALSQAVAAARAALRMHEVSLASEPLSDWADGVRVVQAHEVWQVHGAWVSATRPAFGPGIAERFAAASRVTHAERDAAARRCQERSRRVLDLVGDDAVLVVPTSPSPAPRRDASEEELTAWRGRVMALTSMANVSGCPQVTVPAGTVDGAPVALSLLGPRDSDVDLVALAARLWCGGHG